jgi:hypothetical protein
VLISVFSSHSVSYILGTNAIFEEITLPDWPLTRRLSVWYKIHEHAHHVALGWATSGFYSLFF